MKFLLDSSTCVAHLRGRAPSVSRRLAAHPNEIALCSVVILELLAGAHRSRDPQGERSRADWFISGFPSLPFDDRAASHAARLRAELAVKGTPIGPYDLLIAAIARANGLTLVTSNVGEFSRVSGLSIENWSAE